MVLMIYFTYTANYVGDTRPNATEIEVQQFVSKL